MNTATTTPSPSWLAGLWAGLATATICYAEYLGLGAVLGPALLGYGDQSKSVGTLLVVLSASVACMSVAWRRIPYVAGPRGASISVLVLGLLFLQKTFPTTAGQQVAAIICVLLGCMATLWLASTRKGLQLFAHQPRWLMPAFMYASAVGILASATNKYLYGCLQVSPMAAWSIYGGASLLGLCWPPLVQRLARKVQPSAPRLALRLQACQGLSLIVAGAVVWVAYTYSPLAHSAGGQCARLGQVDLHVDVLWERLQYLGHSLQGNWPWPAWLAALLLGLCVGSVVTIEARSTLDALNALKREEVRKHEEACQHAKALGHEAAPPPHSQPLRPTTAEALREQAGLTALLLPAATAPAPYSQSRTLMLWHMGGRSAWAVACHAVALLGIALLASQWLAPLPQLALAVLMTLVATSMVNKSVQDIWGQAYNDHNANPAGLRTGLRAGLGLWLVLGITALSGQVLVGFALPAAFYALYRFQRRRRFAQHLRTQAAQVSPSQNDH